MKASQRKGKNGLLPSKRKLKNSFRKQLKTGSKAKCTEKHCRLNENTKRKKEGIHAQTKHANKKCRKKIQKKQAGKTTSETEKHLNKDARITTKTNYKNREWFE